MKKLFVCVVMLVVFTVAGVMGASNKVVVEAEKYKTITASMHKNTSTVCSGGAFLEIPLRRPHATSETAPSDTGNATYSVKIPAKGSYRFWARCHWHDGCGNSFWLNIGSNPAFRLGQDGTYQRWHWVKGPQVTLPAGNVTVRIQNCEDGAKIDQFLLTTSTVVPVRIEKPTQ